MKDALSVLVRLTLKHPALSYLLKMPTICSPFSLENFTCIVSRQHVHCARCEFFQSTNAQKIGAHNSYCYKIKIKKILYKAYIWKSLNPHRKVCEIPKIEVRLIKRRSRKIVEDKRGKWHGEGRREKQEKTGHKGDERGTCQVLPRQEINFSLNLCKYFYSFHPF